jgi:hypothetical protein
VSAKYRSSAGPPNDNAAARAGATASGVSENPARGNLSTQRTHRVVIYGTRVFEWSRYADPKNAAIEVEKLRRQGFDARIQRVEEPLVGRESAV